MTRVERHKDCPCDCHEWDKDVFKEERFYISFYPAENMKAMDRKVYNCSYGAMIYHARKYGEKIGAKFFVHFNPLRQFNVKDEDY